MSVTCPRCHESSVHRSHRKRLDILPRLFGMIAVRCNFCERRFFRSRHALYELSVDQRTPKRPSAGLHVTR